MLNEYVLILIAPKFRNFELKILKVKKNEFLNFYVFLKNYLNNSLFDLRKTCSPCKFTYNKAVKYVRS